MLILPFMLLIRVRSFLRRNFVRLAGFVVAVVAYGTISEYLLESGAQGTGIKNIFDALWFVMQTITTVGYGDTLVVTFWGRVNAIFLMVVGIGVLGFFSASFASLLIDYSSKRKLGERKIRMKNHIVICNWNSIAGELVSQIVKVEPTSIAVLALIDKSPAEEVEFVKGTCLHASDLERVDVGRAESVIILAETITDGELASAIDAKTILGAMNARKLSKNTHIVAEILKNDSVENARAAGADEVVVRGEVSAKLLSRAALYPGTADIIETILTARSGSEIFEEPLPAWAKGKTWSDVSKFFLEKNATPIALRSSSGLKVNPPSSSVMEETGSSIVYFSSAKVASER